jgi:hypothetical protein
MTHPQGGEPGHPEPAPMPSPDPEPPQPIPPEEPIPTPEPPHAFAADASAPAASFSDVAVSDAAVSDVAVSDAALSDAAASVSDASLPDAAPAGDFIDAPPVGDFIDAPPVGDFIDAPPVGEDKFPPRGSFEDERPTVTVPAVPPSHESTQVIAPEAVGTQIVPAPASGWQPPPATSPWHAQHEAPGQWQTQPPEHLAWHHSVPAEGGPQPSPIWTAEQPPPAPAWQAPEKRPRRRGALWVSIALTATVLLCGGGATSAYLLLRDADNPGAPDPATAVDRFLTAVYTDQDAEAADNLVCREARDQQKITNRVREIKTYSAGYQDPVYRWDEPAVSDNKEDRAQVAVHITMSTTDEKTAAQDLKFTVIHKTGWLVCDVTG